MPGPGPEDLGRGRKPCDFRCATSQALVAHTGRTGMHGLLRGKQTFIRIYKELCSFQDLD